MNTDGSRKLPALFFLLTLATRLPFADRFLYHYDSVQFALALDRYDVSVHQPHPPGYFLYVMLGRLFRLLTGDANAALVLMSAVFSGAAVALVFHMGDRMFGRREGVAAAVIALVSPMLWLHGIVALSYAAEGFFSLLVAWLCWRLIKGEGSMLWASAVALGAAAGFRQSSLMFLLPLWLYAVRRQGAKRVMLALALLCASVLAWFLPMVYLTGGYRAYMDALGAHSSGLSLLQDGWPSKVLSYVKQQALFIVWGLLAALLPVMRRFIFRGKGAAPFFADGAMPAFFLMWLTPSFLFYVFVHSSMVNPGYSLVYLAGLFILAGRAVLVGADVPSGSKTAWMRWLAFIVLCNTAAFFFTPFWFSYRAVSDNNRALAASVEAVRKNFAPEDTVIAAFEDFYAGFRHAAYYLPEYTVYDIFPKKTVSGEVYLRCRGGDTGKSRAIVIPPGARYLVVYRLLLTPLRDNGLARTGRLVPLGEGLAILYFDCRELAKSGDSLDKLITAVDSEAFYGPPPVSRTGRDGFREASK